MLVDSPHERAWRETLRELIETRWSGIRANTTWAARAVDLLRRDLISQGPNGLRIEYAHCNEPGREV